jgi:MYXO-CTERM domain-containing protein
MGIPTGGDCSKPDGSECQGAACYQGDPDRHYCTNVCDPSVPESCPGGMMCTKDGPAVFLCTYPKQSHGCSAAPGQPGDAAFGFILLMGLAAVLRLRRARG